jgi:hypothetical protein
LTYYYEIDNSVGGGAFTIEEKLMPVDSLQKQVGAGSRRTAGDGPPSAGTHEPGSYGDYNHDEKSRC